MARKRKATKPPREITRRQLARWQRQKKRQRLVFIVGIATIIAALLLVLVGWFTTSYRPLHQTVVKVNDTEFNLKYYVELFKLYSRGQQPQDLAFLANDLVSNIQREELIRQEALKLGIRVSDEEVKAQLKNAGLPDDRVYWNLISSQLLAKKLQDEYFDKQVPAAAEQVHMLAMLLETKSQAEAVRARLEKGESFADLAGELSLSDFSKKGKGDIGSHPQSIFADLLGSPVPSDYAFGAEAGMLSQPRYDAEVHKQVGYWLVKVLEKKAASEEARVNVVLLGSETEAREIRAKLEVGQDFATLAKEFSQLEGAEDNGGDLGPITKGTTTQVIDQYIFDSATKLGTVSQPIRDTTVVTRGGYWLVKVLERIANKPINEDDRSRLKAKAFNEWVVSLLANPANSVETYLDKDKIAFAIQQVTKK